MTWDQQNDDLVRRLLISIDHDELQEQEVQLHKRFT